MSAIAKLPLLNLEAFLISEQGWHVPRAEVEEEYARFINLLRVQDPRTMQVDSPDDAASAVAAVYYISSMLINGHGSSFLPAPEYRPKKKEKERERSRDTPVRAMAARSSLKRSTRH